MLGVVYGEPVNRFVPPVGALHQVKVLPAEVADNDTVPVPHLEPLVTVGAAGMAFTVTCIESKQPVLNVHLI